MRNWIASASRAMAIATKLFQKNHVIKPLATTAVQELIESEKIAAYKVLDDLQLKLKKRTSSSKSIFKILFALCDFIVFQNSYIFLDSNIQGRFWDICISLFHSQEFNSGKDQLLINFLREHYGNLFISGWTKSHYNSIVENIATLFPKELDYCSVDIVYCGTLRALTLSVLRDNSRILPTFTDLGLYDVNCLIDLLKTYNINCSGPYKKTAEEKTEIEIFVIGQNSYENLYNSGLPVYGIMTFPAKSIKCPAGKLENYIDNLAIIPAWLQYNNHYYDTTAKSFKTYV